MLFRGRTSKGVVNPLPFPRQSSCARTRMWPCVRSVSRRDRPLISGSRQTFTCKIEPSQVQKTKGDLGPIHLFHPVRQTCAESTEWILMNICVLRHRDISHYMHALAIPRCLTSAQLNANARRSRLRGSVRSQIDKFAPPYGEDNFNLSRSW